MHIDAQGVWFEQNGFMEMDVAEIGNGFIEMDLFVGIWAFVWDLGFEIQVWGMEGLGWCIGEQLATTDKDIHRLLTMKK